MGNSPDSSTEIDGDRRFVDRSGDIDQRPPEERTGDIVANAITFRRGEPIASEPPNSVQRYGASSPPAAGFEPALELAEIAQRLQKNLDKRYAGAKSQLEALIQKIEAQEKRCLAPKLEGDLQQIRFLRDYRLGLFRYVNKIKDC